MNIMYCSFNPTFRYQDPTHLNFTRVRSATEIPMCEGGSLDDNYPNDVGFNHHVTTEYNNATNDFRPPCLLKIDRYNSDGSKVVAISYATPTRLGQCRVINTLIEVTNKDKQVLCL